LPVHFAWIGLILAGVYLVNKKGKSKENKVKSQKADTFEF
jgi:hypothetical protein